MNAIDLLKQDHRKVEQLFKAWEKSRDGRRKQQIVEQICQELAVHAQIEEEIFYPALEQSESEDAGEKVAEAYVEHDQVKQLISDIEAEDEGQEKDARVKVMKENVEHHVEEEENEIFKLARKQLKDQLEELGEDMEERKMELLEGGASRGGGRKKPAARRKTAARKTTAARKKTPARGGARKKAVARGGARKKAPARKKTPARGGARKKAAGRSRR